MKKKIFKILSVIITLLLFVGVGISVNAYSLDSNGNIVSDNLTDLNGFNATSGITMENQTINVPGGLGVNWYGTLFVVTLESGTYTMSIESTAQSGNVGRIQINDSSIAQDMGNTYVDKTINESRGFFNNPSTFTLTSDTTLYARFCTDVDYNGNSTNGTTISNSFKIMLNRGNTALSYEPAGTWYSNNNSQIKQAIGALANTNSIVVDLLESGEIYNSETYPNFFDLPFTTSYGQLTIPVNVFENWNESQHPNAVGNITFNYSDGIVPTNTYGTIYVIRWDYYTEITVTYYNGTSQRYQSTGDSIQITNPSSTYIKSIKFDTSENLGNYSQITFALDNNYSAGYEQGYSNGNQTGYQNGYNAGSTGKYQEGYNNGYNEGYEQGYEDNPEDKTLYNMVLAIADVPITLFTQIFNFDILGVNIAGFVTSLVSIAIIVWLVKFFI